MGRPREFDADEALGQAMLIFWAKGYQAASLADVMQATGLQKQSLYCAFGDKRSLFLRALELYRHRTLPAVEALLALPGSALQRIHGVFAYALERSSKLGVPAGCLAASTALELGADDADALREVQKLWQGMDRLLAGVVRAGQADGEITKRFPCELIVQSLGNTLNGLRVFEKSGARPDKLRALARVAVEAFRA